MHSERRALGLGHFTDAALIAVLATFQTVLAGRLFPCGACVGHMAMGVVTASTLSWGAVYLGQKRGWRHPYVDGFRLGAGFLYGLLTMLAWHTSWIEAWYNGAALFVTMALAWHLTER